MSLSGLCQICENAEADHSCDQCGQLACDEHWDGELNMCIECAAEIQGGRDRPTNRPGQDDVPDDADTFQF